MFNFNFDWSKSMAAMESLVKQSYDWGAPIEGFVESGAINAEAYKEITGDDYDAGRDPSALGPSKA